MERIPTIYFITNSIIERAQDNMEKYKISVLVCAYNTGAYINRCVNSILQQSYQNIEILILDNGSVDNTWEIITGLKDDRIHKYRVVQNIGVEKGYQILLENVRGDFFLYVDSDDFLKEGSIHTLVNVIRQDNSIDMVFFNHYRYYSESKIEKCAFRGEHVNILPGKDAIKHIFDPWGSYQFKDGINLTDFGSHWGIFYRSSLAKKTSRKIDFAVGYYSDFCYVLDNCMIARKCMIIDECLYYLNRDGNTTTGSNLSEWKMDEFIQALDYLYKKVKLIGNDETQNAFAEFAIGRIHDLLCDFCDKNISAKYYHLICKKTWFKPIRRWYVVSIKKLVSFIVYTWALPLCNFKNLRK